MELSFLLDFDSDGMSDATEYHWQALGFRMDVSQPGMVSAFAAQTSAAGFHELSEIQALNADVPLIQRDTASGDVTLTLGLGKSNDLTNFSPFPFTSPETTINPEGKLEFRLTPLENTAFFRAEAN